MASVTDPTSLPAEAACPMDALSVPPVSLQRNLVSEARAEFLSGAVWSESGLGETRLTNAAAMRISLQRALGHLDAVIAELDRLGVVGPAWFDLELQAESLFMDFRKLGTERAMLQELEARTVARAESRRAGSCRALFADLIRESVKSSRGEAGAAALCLELHETAAAVMARIRNQHCGHLRAPGSRATRTSKLGNGHGHRPWKPGVKIRKTAPIRPRPGPKPA